MLKCTTVVILRWCVVWTSEKTLGSHFPPRVTDMYPGIWEGSYCSHSSTALRENKFPKKLKISELSNKRSFWVCDQKEDGLLSGYNTEYIPF